MDWNTPDLSSWPAKLVIGVGKKLRSSKGFTQEAIDRNSEKAAARRQHKQEDHARKNGYQVRRSQDTASSHNDVNELGEREHSAFSEASTLVDQPNKDHTDMMHRLAHHDSFDSLVDQFVAVKMRDPDVSAEMLLEELHRISSKHEQMIACLPPVVWKRIASYLTPAEGARLATSSRLLREKLGSAPILNLDLPENKHHKIAFLHDFDDKLPRHLLCFPCAMYHLRLNPGKESLKADYVSNPIFTCPNARHTVLPRIRLTHGREIPYSYVQLALRAQKHSHVHGMHHDDLSRRWKHQESGWSHRTRYMIHDGRLLMRVVSQAFAPTAATSTATVERHLLYDREEYIPYFSVCAHWRDGELMQLCKCALSHVPSPPDPILQQLKRAPKINRAAARPNFIVTRCDWCRPARRCPECPTEYLVEIQMVEDKLDHVRPFKHAIVVTRWSDLGDGSSPYTSPEWIAIRAQASVADGGHGEYESFSHVGRRAVSGIFESHISGSIPGQRMLSLNPKNRKLGEEGHGWY